RRLGLDAIELVVDGALETRQKRLRNVRQCVLRRLVVPLGQRSIERLENRVVDRPLLAMMNLQLPLRVVDVDHAEEVLEQKLLRTLPEVLELGGGDAIERLRELREQRGIGDEAVELAVG